MDHPGLDPNTALELIQNLLYWIAYILGGSLFLGLSAYIVFLCLEIFSPQPFSKSRLAKVPHPIGLAPVAEANLELVAAETAILAEARRLGEEAARLPALTHDAQTPMTVVPSLWRANPLSPGASFNSCGFGGQSSPRSAVRV